MRKFIKFVLVLGVILVLAGGAIVGYAAYKGKFKPIEYEQKTYTAVEDFENIRLNLATSDVTFVKALDDKLTINYEEAKGFTHNFRVDANKLSIDERDETPWYERIFRWDFKSPKMTISLPKVTYDELYVEIATGDLAIDNFNFTKVDIKDSTGDVNFKNATITDYLYVSLSTGDINLTKLDVTNEIKLNASTGHMRLEDVTTKAGGIKGSTGDIRFINTVFDGALTVKTSTGNIYFSKSDAYTIEASTSTGDIKGDILTGKAFTTHTSTGSATVPSTTGESCKLSTSTGDIYITISE